MVEGSRCYNLNLIFMLIVLNLSLVLLLRQLEWTLYICPSHSQLVNFSTTVEAYSEHLQINIHKINGGEEVPDSRNWDSINSAKSTQNLNSWSLIKLSSNVKTSILRSNEWELLFSKVLNLFATCVGRKADKEIIEEKRVCWRILNGKEINILNWNLIWNCQPEIICWYGIQQWSNLFSQE